MRVVTICDVQCKNKNQILLRLIFLTTVAHFAKSLSSNNLISFLFRTFAFVA